MISKPKIEGYWWSKHEPQYPKPVACEHAWEGHAEFVAKLKRKEARTGKRQFKGMSTCRICEKLNGSAEFVSGDWHWPSGLMHYIVEHNVKPSQEFLDFVDGKK